MVVFQGESLGGLEPVVFWSIVAVGTTALIVAGMALYLWVTMTDDPPRTLRYWDV